MRWPENTSREILGSSGALRERADASRADPPLLARLHSRRRQRPDTTRNELMALRPARVRIFAPIAKRGAARATGVLTRCILSDTVLERISTFS